MGILHIITRLSDAKTKCFDTQLEKKNANHISTQRRRNEKNGAALGELTKDIVLSMEKKRSNQELPSQYWTPYLYHPLIVTICDIVPNDEAYQVLVQYETSYWFSMIQYGTLSTGTANLGPILMKTFPIGVS